MLKLVLNFNKKKYEIQADSFKSLQDEAFKAINVPPQNLKVIKPLIKNEDGFKKLKNGDELTVMGTPLEKKKEVEVKVQDVAERGIKYTKQDIGHITYVTSSLQVLKAAINVKQFCMEQKDTTNPDKLMAIDLGNVFRQIEDSSKTEPVSPIDIVTSWIAYTEDEFGDFPYKPYDASLFFQRILEMLQEAAVDDYDEHENDPNIIHDIMRLSYRANQKDISCEIEDVMELQEEKRIQHTYFLTCQVEAPIKSVNEGIHAYIKGSRQRIRQLYGVDITYEEQIIGITKLPHYLLVKIDRFTKEGTEEEPSWQKKSCQIAYNKYLNTFPWCAEELQNSLKEGCSKRDEIFQTFEGTPEYAQFDKDYQAKNPGCTRLESCYAYYENKMTVENYSKWIGKVQGKSKTGQFTLVGFVTHMGEKINDTSYFRGVVNRRNKNWSIFNQNDVQHVETAQALSFVGNTADNAAETAYILLYKAIEF